MSIHTNFRVDYEFVINGSTYDTYLVNKGTSKL